MPFSPSVRTAALVAAARHCCVCHRYKGVRVEVHHIVQEADSRDNTAENAIALCFDCHADAGHYNPRHPKGTKMSPQELRAARDRWHQIVAQGPLDIPDPDTLYCRYLLCKSFEGIGEVAGADLVNVPVERPLRVSNDVLSFQSTLVAHYQNWRRETLWGDAYPSSLAYAEAHPDARSLADSDAYSYFEASRDVSATEASSRVVPEDPLTAALLSAGADPTEVIAALAYHKQCAGYAFQEVYRIRPVWAVYLVATNLTDLPLRLDAVVGRHDSDRGYSLRSLPDSPSGDDRQSLPAARLPSGATLLLPVATLVGPLSLVEPDVLSSTRRRLALAQQQVLDHEDASNAAPFTSVVGPAFWPSGILTDGGEQPVHEFDLSNLYAESRYWEMGSCPHLFVRIDGELRFVRELFIDTPGQPNSESYIAPDGAESIVVAELEPETTYIESIHIAGVLALGRSVLQQHEHVELAVASGDEICFTGHYVADLPTQPAPWQKNRVVTGFVRSDRSLPSDPSVAQPL